MLRFNISEKAGIFFCLFFIHFFWSIQSEAQTGAYSPRQLQAHTAIFTMEFEKARKLCAVKNPNALDFQLKSMALVLDVFFSCDKHRYQHSKTQEIHLQDSLKALPESQDKKFALAMVRLHWAFLSHINGEQFSAGVGIRQAFQLLKENHKLYPQHTPTLLYLGVLNQFLSEIPENLSWLAKWVGIFGDERLGQLLVAQVQNPDAALKMELQVWRLALCMKSESEREEILLHTEALEKDYSDMALVEVLLTFVYLRQNMTQTAQNRYMQLKTVRSPLVEYIAGTIHYQMLDLKTADAHFKEFLKHNKSDNLRKDAYAKLFYSAYLQGDSLAAMRYRQHVKRQGQSIYYSDKVAFKNATQPIPPKMLLEGRIYFDGGLWEQSRTALLKYHPRNQEEKAEILYRLGRIDYSMHAPDRAKIHFKGAVQTCPEQGVYYGPYACYYLAKIGLAEHDKQSFLQWIAKSTQFKEFEHKRRLDTKLKALKLQWK